MKLNKKGDVQDDVNPKSWKQFLEFTSRFSPPESDRVQVVGECETQLNSLLEGTLAVPVVEHKGICTLAAESEVFQDVVAAL